MVGGCASRKATNPGQETPRGTQQRHVANQRDETGEDPAPHARARHWPRPMARTISSTVASGFGDEQQRDGQQPDAGGDGRQRRSEHEQAEHHVQARP